MQTKLPYLATATEESLRAPEWYVQRRTEYSLEEIELVHRSTTKED